MNCEARRIANEMHCGKCGLVWSVKDPTRPACNPITFAEKVTDLQSENDTCKKTITPSQWNELKDWMKR